ncbi:MAG: hypothetical protein AAGA48_41030 [Myxococcota bacterium]
MGSLTKRSNNTLPVLFELLPGVFLQVFGIGHIMQGRVTTGLFIMFSYWFLQIINWLLMFVGIGFVTAPLTWLFYAIAAPLHAADFKGDP